MHICQIMWKYFYNVVHGQVEILQLLQSMEILCTIKMWTDTLECTLCALSLYYPCHATQQRQMLICKVSMPNSVTHLKQTSMFKCCVVRCGPKNGHHKKNMCLKEIELRARNLLTFLGSIVNIKGGTQWSGRIGS